MGTNAIYGKLAKLCPGDKFSTQQRIFDDADVEVVGLWFFYRKETQKWLNGDGERVLWLHGPSASGKTFRSSGLASHIYWKDSVGVGAFYFGPNDLQYNLADYDLAFRSITRQLVSQTPDSLGLWQSILDDEEMGVEDLTSTTDILERMANAFENMVIVLDGVDATNETGLAELLSLLLKDKQIPSLRVLLTSRYRAPDVLKDFGLSEVEAHPPDPEIGLYVTKYQEEAPLSSNVMDWFEPSLFPYRKFMDISKGLFLPLLPKWFFNIRSQPNTELFDLIETCWADSEVNAAQEFCRYVAADITSSEQAEAILCTLYHVAKCDEMGYFFTAPMGREALDSWGIRSQDGTPFATEDIMKLCEGLIFVDRKSQAMIVRSPLLMDYLRDDVFTNEYHERQATASIRYLSKPDFANGACKSSQELKQRFKAHPYLWFAAKNNLPKSLPPSFESDFFTFAASQGNLESYLQAREAWPYFDDETYDECEKDTERWNCYTRGTTALGLAVTLGNEAILRGFINRGADLEARDRDLNTALHIAAFDAHESAMIKVLLEAGSNVAVVNEEGLTPLAIAIVHGNLDSVKLLIEFGADIHRVDEEDLRQCVEERPGIAECLVGLGVEMPVENMDEDE